MGLRGLGGNSTVLATVKMGEQVPVSVWSVNRVEIVDYILGCQNSTIPSFPFAVLSRT